jgi:hypothetical protein
MKTIFKITFSCSLQAVHTYLQTARRSTHTHTHIHTHIHTHTHARARAQGQLAIFTCKKAEWNGHIKPNILYNETACYICLFTRGSEWFKQQNTTLRFLATQQNPVHVVMYVQTMHDARNKGHCLISLAHYEQSQAKFWPLSCCP